MHPASAELASESAHWESEATHHDLHAFYAFRRMDEILCANYMLFDDVVRETPYDLWVGDESWEVDHFLHENPERKIAPYAFLTDVVGFLPVDPEGDPREVELCADYNAEMIEHRERFPTCATARCSSAASTSCPTRRSARGCPAVRDWTARWFTSVPYVVPFDPAALPPAGSAASRARLRHRLPALRRRCRRHRRRPGPARAHRRGVRAGPQGAAGRPDGDGDRSAARPGQLPDVEGMDKLGYVASLFEHLACADVAVVQGGLSTTMELVAARRPFVYFPLVHHWEQQHFVAHRLDHYGAGTGWTSPRPRRRTWPPR